MEHSTRLVERNRAANSWRYKEHKTFLLCRGHNAFEPNQGVNLLEGPASGRGGKNPMAHAMLRGKDNAFAKRPAVCLLTRPKWHQACDHTASVVARPCRGRRGCGRAAQPDKHLVVFASHSQSGKAEKWHAMCEFKKCPMAPARYVS